MKNVIVTLFAVMVCMSSCRKNNEEKTTVIEDTVTDHPEETVTAPEEYCYLEVTGKDSIKVNFTKSGDSIQGIYHNLPYGIDKRISTFKGTLQNNHGMAVSKYSSEGTDYTEEIHFNLDGDNLKLKYGPTAQGIDGVWRPKPGESTSEHVLPKTDCN